MLVSTLISTFLTAALLCTAAPAQVDATKYTYYTIHWPTADHNVELHVARGGGRRPRPINPGSKPWVGHPAAFGEYFSGWYMKLDSAGTMSMTDNLGTKMCLDPGSPPQIRNQVGMQHCTGSSNQVWLARNESVIKLKNYDLCLDVPSGNISRAFVQLWPWNPNQIWRFEEREGL